jgi:hypothetical protein
MFLRPALAVLAAALPLAAQSPARPVDRMARTFGAPGEPGYLGNVELTASYVPDSGIREGSVDLGNINTTQTRLKYTGTFISGGPVNWSMGVDAERFGFGLEKTSLLPTALGSVSLPLGVNWRINERWTFLSEVSPGLYSDFEDINASDFNAPLIAGFSYAINDNLLLFLQLSVDARRDVPVVGGPGIRWQFSRQWVLSLLIPRPRIEFRPNASWMFYGGAELAGGAYQLSTTHGTEKGDANFDDVNMTYREIRAGLGAIWDIGHGFRVEAAGGWVFDRRFVVDERNRQWNGEGAIYGRLHLGYRY